MAGVTSPAFRLMAKMGGASLVYTEMVSAKGLVLKRRRTWALCDILPKERPVCLQLFGGEPEAMGRAAAIASALSVDLLDVNMGCPVKKVRRQGAGSALLEDMPRAAEVMAAVVENSSLPVTVKIRLGQRRDDLENIVPPLVKAGAAAVCLHARTTKQLFGGQADWQAITRLVGWCPVPVIGNGDVRSGEDAVRMLEQTGCQAVMIGRGAMGDPWIFRRAAERLAGVEPRPVTLEERRRALDEHMALARKMGGELQAVHFVKQFMMWYTKGLPGATNFRREAGRVKQLDLLWGLCDEFFSQLARHTEGEAA